MLKIFAGRWVYFKQKSGTVLSRCVLVENILFAKVGNAVFQFGCGCFDAFPAFDFYPLAFF